MSDLSNKKTISSFECGDLNCDIHVKGKQYIDHFSNTKIRYKKLALSWSAAYLLLLGYITIFEEHYYFVDKFNLIFFITVFVIIGIKLIQFLDINIGHEQLRNIFKYLLAIEEAHAHSIKPYTKVEKILYNHSFDPVFIDFLFYLSINFGIAMLGISALALKMRAEFLLSMLVSAGCFLIFLMWQVVIIIHLIRRRHRRKKNDRFH